jgi:hypothetical protein
MSGEEDHSPHTLFAVSVQSPRHGDKLVRRVIEDDRLHKVDHWEAFGPVYRANEFKRLLNILERGADLGAKEAVNFVGLAWKNGRPIVVEGADCYFSDPAKQCPYAELVFPSGSVEDARAVIAAYQATFQRNAATLPLIWGLGAHLKAFLGFWPHMVMQADKGAGKSTLVKRLERTIAFTMFSGQSIQTQYRILTSTSHTSQPVGWEEISAREQRTIDLAVSILQESYQFTTTRRGSEMLEYLLSAPVLLAGEDVPVKSLTGKLVRTELTGRKGQEMDEALPRFPVRQWLDFLTSFRREQVKGIYNLTRTWCIQHSMAAQDDIGASRMAGNYAAVITAWRLLGEFAGIERGQGDFVPDVLAEMNAHIADTEAEREPWVWIMEILLSEISAGNFKHPFKFDEVEAERCLCIRPQHVMDHISGTLSLREKWNMLPVKSARVLKRQLVNAGVVHTEDVERFINHRREGHMMAVSLDKLEKFGLHASTPETLCY